jgi:hypothetical protein
LTGFNQNTLSPRNASALRGFYLFAQGLLHHSMLTRKVADLHSIPANFQANIQYVAKKQHAAFIQNKIEFFYSKTVESNPFNNHLVSLRSLEP